jgi:hypothetical protein
MGGWAVLAARQAAAAGQGVDLEVHLGQWAAVISLSGFLIIFRE